MRGLLSRLAAGPRRRLGRSPQTHHDPVEELAADLRRLAAEIDAVFSQDQPAKHHRLRAATLAYDWVLLSACRTLEVPEPGPAPLDPISRLCTEAELAARGLQW
jgi:hypothetical protein